MNLLAIDTSTELASVALLAGDELTSAEEDSQKNHAQLLLPLIDRLLGDSGIAVSQLDGIIFGRGPGSFTGLRIACSIAKGLAYAHDRPLIPVSSLAAIAFQARALKGPDLPVLAVLDARMNEMYWVFFDNQEYDRVEHVSPAAQITIPDDRQIILAGVWNDTYWGNLQDSLKRKIQHQKPLYPHAADMIKLALHAAIKPVSIADAQPVYIRNQVTQGVPRG